MESGEQVDENAPTQRFERIIAPHVPIRGAFTGTVHYFPTRAGFPWSGFAWGFACGGSAVLLILLGAMR